MSNIVTYSINIDITVVSCSFIDTVHCVYWHCSYPYQVLSPFALQGFTIMEDLLSSHDQFMQV